MTEQTAMKEKGRIIWIDAVRICAIVLVVLCHATEGIYNLELETMLTLNTVDKVLVFGLFTIGRLGVPLFLMISGYLLLDRKYDREAMTRFWKKSWLHLIICALVWFLVYDLILKFVFGRELGVMDVLRDLLFMTKVNISHVWYLLMIIGLYPLIPLAANALQAVEDRKQLRIPMAFFFLFLFLYPFLSLLLQVFCPEHPGFSSQLGEGFSGGVYGFYLICGWLLKKGTFKKIRSGWLVLTAVLPIAAAVFIMMSRYAEGVRYKIYYDSVLLLISGVSLFELFSRMKAVRGEKTVTWLAGFAFGVFLTHNPIRLYLMRIMGSWGCARQLKILILWAAVLLLGFAAAWVISLIPKAGNYLIYRKAQKTKQA